MKRITVLYDSIIGKAQQDLLKLIPLFRGGGATFQFFRFARETAKLIGISDNLNQIISTLDRYGVPYEFIKEDGVDEYFFSRRGREDLTVYFAPINNAPLVHRSAVMNGFSGHLYVFEPYPDGSIDTRPQSHDAFINASSLRASAGTKSLNKADASYDHTISKKCYFSINGTRYTEVIGESSSGSGVEGFTQVSKNNPGYILKIWKLNKKQYDIDRVAAMIRYPAKHPEIALPLAFVYNNEDKPIGVVMKNFNGKEISISKIHTLPNSHIIVKQLLEQLLWLQSNGYLHSDVIHNFLWDGNNAHIIDIDSIQFGRYFPTAYSADPMNFLPELYIHKESYFFNTLELCFTALTLLASIYVKPEDLFGKLKNGFWELNKSKLSVIERASPEIAELLVLAHTKGNPVSISRQLDALQKANAVKNAAPAPIKKYSPFISFNLNNLKAPDSDTYDDGYIPEEIDEVIDEVIDNDLDPAEDNACDNTPVNYGVYNPPVNTADNAVGNAYITHHNPQPTPVVEPNNGHINNPHPDFKLTWLQKWLLTLFKMNTVPVGMSDYDIWRTFVEEKRWLKPLIFSSVITLCIIVLLIATIMI